MNKVYFKQEYPGCWWLKELTDIFYFKTINLSTNQEDELIFSWTRNCDLSNYEDNPVRRYDIEIDSEKYYFLIYSKNEIWMVKPENVFEIEKLSREKNILLVGNLFEIVE